MEAERSDGLDRHISEFGKIFADAEQKVTGKGQEAHLATAAPGGETMPEGGSSPEGNPPKAAAGPTVGPSRIKISPAERRRLDYLHPDPYERGSAFAGSGTQPTTDFEPDGQGHSEGGDKPPKPAPAPQGVGGIVRIPARRLPDVGGPPTDGAQHQGESNADTQEEPMDNAKGNKKFYRKMVIFGVILGLACLGVVIYF